MLKEEENKWRKKIKYNLNDNSPGYGVVVVVEIEEVFEVVVGWEVVVGLVLKVVVVVLEVVVEIIELKITLELFQYGYPVVVDALKPVV